MKELDNILEKLTPQVIEWRRTIHANPELGYEEYKTADFIKNILGQAGIVAQTGIAKTGVVALLKGNGIKTIAIRADMDALPISEETGLSFASKTLGKMHACGHDAHTAIVLGVAHALAKMDKLPGNVKFIFQPCEERLPGGANNMIAAGVLENPKVDAILGLHVYPYLPVGIVGIKPGAMMAATDIFSVEIKGKGGHGAAPHTAVDPVVISAQIIIALQTIVSRKINPVEPAVITVGTIHAGERPNIIPSKVVFSGTVRSVDEETRLALKKEIEHVIKYTAIAGGAEAVINYEIGHGTLFNDEKVTSFVQQSISNSFGIVAVKHLEAPSMGGEDFAIFAQNVPANYMFFGCAGDDIYPWHHSCFNINEAVLPFAVKVLTSLILSYLSTDSDLS